MPTEDAFRALARSAPWRWSALRFTRRDGRGEVTLAVRQADLGELAFTSARSQVLDPPLRPDGLVAARPEHLMLDYDEVAGRDYTWVAMLDPVELSAGTVLSDVRADVLRGRPTWRARARAAEGYDPRCGCCPLLWSAISDELEYGDRLPAGERDYPEAFDVALDVETGIVVSLRPVGGRDDWFEVEILDVDPDLGPAPPRAARPRWVVTAVRAPDAGDRLLPPRSS